MSNKTTKKDLKNYLTKNLRYIILIFFIVLFSIFSLRHFILGGKVAASVDALCPFGGFETLLTFITSGGYIPRILASSLILALGVLLTVIVFNRGFCGWMCPFGAIQEFLYKLPIKKFNINKTKQRQKVDKYARYIKYIILAIIIFATYKTGELVFRSVDPFVSFFHFGKGIFWNYTPSEFSEAIIPFIVTIIVLSISIFIERAWCKYLCPLGATTGLIAKFSQSQVNRNRRTCIDCKLCDKVCPVHCKISTKKKVKDVECLSCFKCVDVCPKNSLEVESFKSKLKKPIYILALIALFYLVILFAQNVGVWQSVPNIQETLSTSTGEFNPDMIKGWMTLAEVSTESGICISHMVRDLELPEDLDPNIAIKEISEKYGIDFHTETLKEYIGDFEHDEDNPNDVHHEEVSDIDCPWGLQEDPYPGRCGLYDDQDGNGYCDLSE